MQCKTLTYNTRFGKKERKKYKWTRTLEPDDNWWANGREGEESGGIEREPQNQRWQRHTHSVSYLPNNLTESVALIGNTLSPIVWRERDIWQKLPRKRRRSNASAFVVDDPRTLIIALPRWITTISLRLICLILTYTMFNVLFCTWCRILLYTWTSTISPSNMSFFHMIILPSSENYFQSTCI